MCVAVGFNFQYGDYYSSAFLIRNLAGKRYLNFGSYFDEFNYGAVETGMEPYQGC